jgi:hypothetical protein
MGLLLAVAVGAVRARADVPPPLPWQEPNPVARLFLQLPLEAPEVAPEGEARPPELRVLYSNSVLDRQAAGLDLAIHVETAAETILFRSLVAPGVELELGIPFVSDTGGFLDPVITRVEGVFSAVNVDRARMGAGVARYRLLRADGRGIDARAGGGVGDAWAALRVLVRAQDGAWPAIALRPAVKLATGRLPYGSGEPDLGGSVLAAWTFGRYAVRTELDVIAPTERLSAVDLATHPYGAFQVALSARLGDRVSVHLQGAAHTSPLGGTGLDPLDANTYYVLAGLRAQVGRAELHFGLVENVFSPSRGADFSVLGGVRLVR